MTIRANSFWILGALVSALAAGGADTARAAFITDPAGDFLASFQGAPGGDLDVLGVEVRLDVRAQTISFIASLAANVGTTPGAFYVWGLDRGRGTPGFAANEPALAGVLFDSVLILRPDGTGSFNDILNSANSRPTLPAGAIGVSGSTLTATFSTSFFAPAAGGRPIEQWGFNLWPRASFSPTGAPVAGFAAISDFAPNTTTFLATAVPEPSSGILALIGVGASLGVLGLRRREAARG